MTHLLNPPPPPPPPQGAAVLALPDIEVNGIDHGNNMAATWWAQVQAHDWLKFQFSCSGITAKLGVILLDRLSEHS